MDAMNVVKDSGYVAVTEKLDTAGAIVWWRLSGGLDLAKLEAAWAAEGLDTEWLPEEPTPAVALRRAVSELKTTKRLVRQTSTGWVVKDEHANGEDDVDYTTALKCSLDKVGRLKIEGGTLTEEERVRAEFKRYSEELVQADVTAWLSGLMEKVQAVALRPTGGIYFIPRYCTGAWTSVVTAIRNASGHSVFGIPALRTEDAVAAIEDAIAQEAEAAIATIEREMNENEFGKRALEHRIGVTETVEAKLAGYEGLLGSRLDALHGKLEKLRADIAKAIVKTNVEPADAAQSALFA